MSIQEDARRARAVAARRKKQAAAAAPGAVQVPVTTNSDEPGNAYGVPDMPRPAGSSAPGGGGA